jgi:glycolate oxidase FAD binding subunit
LGGTEISQQAAAEYWSSVREQTLVFFAGATPLWRCSLPFNAAALQLEGTQLIEWNGAQRWLRSSLPAAVVRARVAALRGHATLFRGGDGSAGAFQPLTPAVMQIHARVLHEFDPHGVFDTTRLLYGFRHANQAR